MKPGVHKRRKGPVALIIMDGVGLNPDTRGNAVAAANKPNLDKLFATRPHGKLMACGEDVGLMPGQMGDSNVGHLNLGAGRVVYQYMLRIRNEIQEGSFFKNEVLVNAVRQAAQDGKALHLMGLVSPGGVHSHTEHLIALVRLAKNHGCEKVYVHAFTDGRDVSPSSGHGILQDLEATLQELGAGQVATVVGRYYAMDRDRRWERTQQAYDAIVYGRGYEAATGADAVAAAYERGETDEFIKATVIKDESGEPVGTVKDGDSIIFFNFRADRARQLTRAFTEEGFSDFPIDANLKVKFTTLTRYDETFDLPYAYAPIDLKNTLGEVASHHGIRQLRVAETEKYAHVTFFFNGGKETPFPGEDQKLIPSPKVATYDLQPEMSAYGVAQAVVEAIENDAYDLYIVNFANGDMVGHTGVFEAAVKAVEAVDDCVGRILAALLPRGGAAIVTADHGNSDQMVDYETGEAHTFHTLYPVPVIYVGPDESVKGVRDGRLADVAPTILDMLGVQKPEEMTGESLLVR